MENTYCVIMAGGIGSRFWPMSKTKMPKQFLDILGTGQTLIQMTVERFKNICPKENILIVTNEIYREIIKEQLPDLSEDQILYEPARRNTAPCIAYANYKIAAKNPNASIIVAPSDHLVLKDSEFEKTINAAINQTKHCECLVTLGIKPSRPDTGYGYIQFTETNTPIGENVRKVKTFTEKPTLEIAKQFLEDGDFYWNSGIFIWSLPAINTAFEKYLPEIDSLFKEGEGLYNTEKEEQFIRRIYPACESESIDFGIMEKADNVFVVLSDFGWSDLGTWGSLYTHLDKDKNGNGVVGDRVFMYDSKNCVVNVKPGKTAVIQGLEDYIVVMTTSTLLICKKDDEQQIKKFSSVAKTKKK